MIGEKDILDEKNILLHKVCEEVKFPLLEEDKILIEGALQHLRLSQDEEYAEKNNIRGGMGLAFPQLGKLKRIFVISYMHEDGEFEEYTVINPEIISHSEELIFVEEGEGCLSVNREVDGIVPRYARITVKYFDESGNEIEVRVREEIAVAFQHEIDHLNGILFVDKIDKSHPFLNKENMRAI